MSKLLPIIGGITGTVAIGGGGAYLISTQRAPTFKEKFKHALIDLDSTDQALLKTKFEKLKTGTIHSKNEKLKEAQTKAKQNPNTNHSGLDELKQACKEIYEESFNKKDSPIFKDFQAYCAKTNKDKIEKDKWNNDGTNPKWIDNHNKLKSATNSLVDKLVEISQKTSATGDELKDWCKDNGDLVFEGEEDKAFKNIQEFCTKP